MSQAVLSVIPGISSWFFLEAKTKKKVYRLQCQKKGKGKENNNPRWLWISINNRLQETSFFFQWILLLTYNIEVINTIWQRNKKKQTKLAETSLVFSDQCFYFVEDSIFLLPLMASICKMEKCSVISEDDSAYLQTWNSEKLDFFCTPLHFFLF